MRLHSMSGYEIQQTSPAVNFSIKIYNTSCGGTAQLLKSH